MNLRSIYKHLAWLLAILLIIAPISAAFGGNSMSHSSMGTELDSLKTMNMSHQVMTDTNTQNHAHDNSNKMDNQSCQVECAHCVFCSATSVTTSLYTFIFNNTILHEILITRLQSIDVFVDIRPPIIV